MSVTAEKKAEIIKDNAQAKGDTGSPEVQVAILTERIRNLTAIPVSPSLPITKGRSINFSLTSNFTVSNMVSPFI